MQKERITRGQAAIILSCVIMMVIAGFEVVVTSCVWG